MFSVEKSGWYSQCFQFKNKKWSKNQDGIHNVFSLKMDCTQSFSIRLGKMRWFRVSTKVMFSHGEMLSFLSIKVSKGPLSQAHRLERSGGMWDGGASQLGRGR